MMMLDCCDHHDVAVVVFVVDGDDRDGDDDHDRGIN